jgi:hypothetical protein
VFSHRFVEDICFICHISGCSLVRFDRCINFRVHCGKAVAEFKYSLYYFLHTYPMYVAVSLDYRNGSPNRATANSLQLAEIGGKSNLYIKVYIDRFELNGSANFIDFNAKMITSALEKFEHCRSKYRRHSNEP